MPLRPLSCLRPDNFLPELLEEVARFAGVLRGLGVNQGDRVIIYMPMIPRR